MVKKEHQSAFLELSHHKQDLEILNAQVQGAKVKSDEYRQRKDEATAFASNADELIAQKKYEIEQKENRNVEKQHKIDGMNNYL